MLSRRKFKWIKYFFLLFYFIYLPEFFLVLNIPIRSQLVVLLATILILLKKTLEKILNKKKMFLWSSNLNILFTTILFSIFYFVLISIYYNQDHRILQNSFLLFHIFVLIYLLNQVYLLNKDNEDCLKIILQMASFQGILAISSYFIPVLKTISLKLYYLGREENIFISNMRIYGISGEYTFHTPIYHGLLLSIILYLILFKQRNYLIYFPFIFVAMILNGRTGLFIFIICTLVMLSFYILMHPKNIYKILPIIILSFIFISLTLLVTEEFLPSTFNWIHSSIEEVIIYITEGKSTGTLTVLRSMIIFPKGINLLFGSGFRLYGNTLGLPHSDIGYINDLFMGGIIYSTILYTGIFIYIFYTQKKQRNVSSFILSIILLINFLLANYKGEVSRGGLVLIGIVILKYVIVDLKDINIT